MPQLQFLGAAGTVTGSKYLLTTDSQKILIDCGLFQGGKELHDKNLSPFPIPPGEITAVLITHAHLDHTGYLPKLVELGYRGKIYATPSTIELLNILLLDSAHLQEEEVAFHKQGNGCCPDLKPLYTVQDALEALRLMTPIGYRTPLQLGNVTAEFMPAGHILGSAFIKLSVNEEKKKTTVLFTGDIGRSHSPILNEPAVVEQADYVLLESTYGNRMHESIPKEEALLPAIQECLKRSGCLLIPAFTVGRTQEILYTLRQLLIQKKSQAIPTYIDSPMAIDVTHIYEAHHDEHDLDMETLEKNNQSPFHFPGLHYVRTVAESKALNKVRGPVIIISANGMATGGRIMHHLFHRLPDPNTVLLFVGYQAEETRGRELLEGAKSVRILHQDISVKALVMQADAFSAHGDYGEILQWLGGFKKPAAKLFLVHGEADARQALKGHIQTKFPLWNVELPKEMEVQQLDGTVPTTTASSSSSVV